MADQIRRHYDEETDTLTVVETTDIQPAIEANQHLQKIWDGFSAAREMRETHRIPVTLIDEWKSAYGVDFYNPDHADAVRKLISANDDWLRVSGKPHPNIIIKGAR